MENGNNLIHSFNHTDNTEGNFKGLTKREYFAGLVLSNIAESYVASATVEEHCIFAIKYADELLKQLEQTK